MKNLTAETIETLLAAQGVRLAPGRAERLAPGLNALNVADPMRETLPFDVNPLDFVSMMERT